MRNNTTKWYRFARGYQATVRNPYYDLEVVPLRDGWFWRALAMDSKSGCFSALSSGTARELEQAKTMALDAVTQRTDWVRLIQAQLQQVGLTTTDLAKTLHCNGLDSLGERDQSGLQRCYVWLTECEGLDVVRDTSTEPK